MGLGNGSKEEEGFMREASWRLRILFLTNIFFGSDSNVLIVELS